MTPVLAIGLGAAFLSATLYGIFSIWYRCQKQRIKFAFIPSYAPLATVPGIYATASMMLFDNQFALGLFKGSEELSDVDFAHPLLIGLIYGICWEMVVLSMLSKVSLKIEGAERFNKDFFPILKSFLTGDFVSRSMMKKLARREDISRHKFISAIQGAHPELTLVELRLTLGATFELNPNTERRDEIAAFSGQLFEQCELLSAADLGLPEGEGDLQQARVRRFLLGVVNNLDTDERGRFLEVLDLRNPPRVAAPREQLETYTVPSPSGPSAGAARPADAPAPTAPSPTEPEALPTPADLSPAPAMEPVAASAAGPLANCRRVVVLATDHPGCDPIGIRQELRSMIHGHLIDGFEATRYEIRRGDGVLFLDDSLTRPKADSEYGHAARQRGFLNALAGASGPSIPMVVASAPGASESTPLNRPWIRIELADARAATEMLRSVERASTVQTVHRRTARQTSV